MATISESGAIVALAAGSTAIIATAKNATGSDMLVVTAPVPPPVTRRVVAVSVTAQSMQLRVGQTTRVSATARDSAGAVIEGRPIIWSVDSGTVAVATVSSSGTVTAIAAGTAIIRATIDSVFATTVVFVTSAPVPPTSGPMRTVTVTLALDSLNVGQSTQALATARDSAGAVVTGQAVTWSISSGSSVASVSSNGMVTALTAGTAIVQATIGGVSGAATLTVTPPPSLPPQTGSSSVPVLVQRLTAGTGPVLVSNAIPLKPGMLFSNGLGNVALWINGVEVPAGVAATAGSHKDGSLRSVLVQTTYDVPAAGIAATLQLGAARTKAAAAAPIPSVPLAVALPTDPTYLTATGLVGPTLPVSAVNALGVWAQYESEFVKYADRHWTQTADAWSGNYYDRAQIYYAWWVRTGNPEYWRRGTLMALNYRINYLEANNYGASNFWSQLEGVALHYRLTGDPMSQKAVGARRTS
ncbi:MAG: Ig-like domain-containing protein [Gemmatimonadetes bacterium]|nr:Ig-like domain-containing protein [Gemmatimonadota bacterium]